MMLGIMWFLKRLDLMLYATVYIQKYLPENLRVFFYFRGSLSERENVYKRNSRLSTLKKLIPATILINHIRTDGTAIKLNVKQS